MAKKKKKLPWRSVHADSVFMDSGAFSLFMKKVLKKGQAIQFEQGDYSFYDLTKGSDFRKYCDSYAAFIRAVRKTDPGMMFTNVDAIYNPELSWEIQRFFEEEHGLDPVPVVHCGADLKWIDRYVEAGRYDLLGLGGFATLTKEHFTNWGDRVFCHLCPESNDHFPVIKTHGYAMTSFKLMLRWPWYSVDSASWVKYSAYGWICFPKYDFKRERWRYDLPPLVINFSWRSPQKANRGKHIDNVPENIRRMGLKWVEYCGLVMGEVDEKGNEIVPGVATNHPIRNRATSLYMKELEEHMPEYPVRLDPKIVKRNVINYTKGFGL